MPARTKTPLVQWRQWVEGGSAYTLEGRSTDYINHHSAPYDLPIYDTLVWHWENLPSSPADVTFTPTEFPAGIPNGETTPGTITYPDSWGGAQIDIRVHSPGGDSWEAFAVSPFPVFFTAGNTGREYRFRIRGNSVDKPVSHFEFQCVTGTHTIPINPSLTKGTAYYADVSFTVPGQSGVPIRFRAIDNRGMPSAWCELKLRPHAVVNLTQLGQNIYLADGSGSWSPDSTIPDDKWIWEYIPSGNPAPVDGDLETTQLAPDKRRIDANAWSLRVGSDAILGVRLGARDARGALNYSDAPTIAYARVTPRHISEHMHPLGIAIAAKTVPGQGTTIANNAGALPGQTAPQPTSRTKLEVSRRVYASDGSIELGEPVTIELENRTHTQPCIWRGKDRLYLTARGSKRSNGAFGMWESLDNGRTWEPVTKDEQQVEIFKLMQPVFVEVLPTPDGGAVAIGVLTSKLVVWKRSPDGVTWSGTPTSESANSVGSLTTLQPVRANYRLGEIWVRSAGGQAWRSPDLARSWQEVTPSP